MFSPRLDDKCLIFIFGKEQIVPLHMMFVFFPIDIVFLNRTKQIVESFENAKPFISYITPKRKAMYVIELPAGTIRKNHLKTGDKLEF